MLISIVITLLHRGFNEAVNGFMDEGWSMIESDGVDDVTILVNSSPNKMMGANQFYSNGFPSVGTSVLCARASMLLQVCKDNFFVLLDLQRKIITFLFIEMIGSFSIVT